MKNIDLQCHTTASDGKLKPRDLVKLAIYKRLSAVAITDHDNINGIDEAVKTAEGKYIEIISGVEITCDDDGFIDTHILGLFIDHKNKTLNSLLKKSQKYREEQKRGIIKALKKKGFNITYKEVKDIAKGEMGRPHIAKVMLKNNPEKVSSFDDVFNKYLGVGKNAYVKRKNKISIKQAVKAIHAANGLAFIAHPGVYDNDKRFNVLKFIKYCKKNGVDGIETYYNYEGARYISLNKMNNKIAVKYHKIAKKYNLLETGGSDFHGKEGQVLGKLKVPYSILENLKKRLKR